MSSNVNVHGSPGQRLREDGGRKYGAADASRGAFFERVVARALEHWLSRRPDCAGLHLFHDLGGFDAVAGYGYGPVSLGTANIDHVVLSGAQWLLVNAKGIGGGILTTDSRNRGVLIRADGTSKPQRWLDSQAGRPAAGVLVRLTGLRGWPVWVLPDATTIGPGLGRTRALAAGGTITQISDVYRGSLDKVLPVPQSSANPSVIAALARFIPASS
jgi:hypothetical protein